MNKTLKAITAALATMLFCAVTLAQAPVVDIDNKLHPNLAEAQHLIVQANQYITTAQKDNRYDMGGHASKAKEHLYEASRELKAAAEAATAAGVGKKH
jgi:hypothetical protein